MRHLLPVVILLSGSLILAGCDSSGSASETAECDSRTGNSMSATVNGEALCTDLGTAMLIEVAGPRLSVVGLFDASASGSVSFNVSNPAVATFDLAQTDADHDAMYGMANETAYHVNREEGSGSVTITQMNDARVKGTFEFTGVGYDVNGNPTWDQATVTDGRFDFALSN